MSADINKIPVIIELIGVRSDRGGDFYWWYKNWLRPLYNSDKGDTKLDSASLHLNRFFVSKGKLFAAQVVERLKASIDTVRCDLVQLARKGCCAGS